jgi:TIGR03009 family protein
MTTRSLTPLLIATLLIATPMIAWLVDSAAAQNRPSPYERIRVAQQPRPNRGPAPRQAVRPGTSAAVPARAAVRPPARQVVRSPFMLTQQQQQFLDAVLNHWEKESAKVRKFSCKFVRYEYDPVWVKDGFRVHKTESDGELKYAKPDKGMFNVTKIRHLTQVAGQKPRYAPRKGELGEKWITDGRAIWEFDVKGKRLVEHQLPPGMQGKAISQGPLPFLFGAKAADLKARYWMRITTPPAQQGKQIWLESFPRRQHDAANFRRVELILSQKTFLPEALQVYLPNGKNRTVYTFYDHNMNDPLGFLKGDFSKPRLPSGWQKVVQAPPAQPGRRPAADKPRNAFVPQRGGAFQRR